MNLTNTVIARSIIYKSEYMENNKPNIFTGMTSFFSGKLHSTKNYNHSELKYYIFFEYLQQIRIQYVLYNCPKIAYFGSFFEIRTVYFKTKIIYHDGLHFLENYPIKFDCAIKNFMIVHLIILQITKIIFFMKAYVSLEVSVWNNYENY